MVNVKSDLSAFPSPHPLSSLPAALCWVISLRDSNKQKHVYRDLVYAWNHDRNIIDTSLKGFVHALVFLLSIELKRTGTSSSSTRAGRDVWVEMDRRRIDAPTTTTQ